MSSKATPTAGQPTSTQTLTFGEVTKEIARRNDETQKVARQARTVREKEAVARRRRWEQL